MFKAAGKNPNVHQEKGKLWLTHTVEYYTAIRNSDTYSTNESHIWNSR